MRTPLAQDSRVAGTHGMEEILFIQISTVLALSVYMWYTGASRNLPANMRSAHIDGKKIYTERPSIVKGIFSLGYPCVNITLMSDFPNPSPLVPLI